MDIKGISIIYTSEYVENQLNTLILINIFMKCGQKQFTHTFLKANVSNVDRYDGIDLTYSYCTAFNFWRLY